ncbi:Small subunit (SSU) processome component [Paramecium bursaria]
MRKLKFHEKKLLKRVDLYNWKKEQDHREVAIIKKYHLQNRDDYDKYNRLCGHVTSLISKIKLISNQDPFRIKLIEQLLEKLYNMGIINTKESIEQCEKLPVSSFCRRRLPIILCKLKLAQTPKEACTYIEQGHIRIGPKIITDSALLVTRSMEDHITWADQSKIKQRISEYNNERDDYEG